MADDPIFPTEIIETIVGNLADDLETLRICALVSWTFYGLARLFTRLQVGPRVDQEHSLAKLCELLEGSPSFAAGVQSLCICEDWKQNRPRWIPEADLSRCFSLLGSLTCLAIKGFPYKLVWSKFSVANRDSIQAILPILTSLELHYVSEFPLTILSHCSLLRSLTLYAVTLAKHPDLVVVDTVKVSRIQLRHLDFHVHASVVDRFLDWITSTDPDSPLDIGLSSLKCSINYHSDGRLAIQRLLNAFAPSLQHLHIDYYDHLNTHRDKLDLRMLLHLRKLTLGMVLLPWRDCKDMLSLRHVSVPLLQQRVALVLNIYVSEYSLDQVVQQIATVDSVWATLPAIASVLVNIWYPRDDYVESFVDVSDKFVQQMPLLANKLADTGGLRVLKRR
ncbi:hypothetical protein C8R45DRAFT_990056 [Mycena sanguinolenta]|nr:hypothetical protein C8R45DRAFT_990056 [Mycena sanguinolenta]